MSTATEGHRLDRPLIFPGRISHRRLHPKRHAFSYSYLLVCIPVGWQGCVNDFLSVDTPLHGKKGWLQVNAAGRLSRDDSISSLRGKLDDYLKSQSIDPAGFPYAILVCQPTVLGYHFNPASFWHLYAADKSHKALVVEVNNTFDERRMYFMRASEDDARGKASRIASTWNKDFHVSPFNSRLGTYSIMALDPLAGCTSGDSMGNTLEARLDTTITLSSSDGSPKLIARTWSTENAIDPASLTLIGKTSFLLSWWWVGLVTFPRIVREAFRLFFHHGMHVWYRPEVLPTASGRAATSAEKTIETYFRHVIEDLVKKSPSPLILAYTTPESFGLPTTLISSDEKSTAQPPPRIDLKITTPAFYSRMIHHTGVLGGLKAETFDADQRNRTAWCSDETVFTSFLNSGSGKTDLKKRLDVISSVLLAIAKYLRVEPPAMSYPWPAISSPKGAAPEPSESERLSSADGPLREFVLKRASSRNARTFLATEIEVFASERFALGSSGLLRLEVLLAMGLACAVVIFVPWLRPW